MRGQHLRELREQGRGVVGALLVVGLSLTYTMETWWLGWRLPMAYLLGYAVLGLAVISVITQEIGFREEQSGSRDRNGWSVVTSFAELVLQSFLAAYGMLVLFGVLQLGDSATAIVRSGLILVVPMGFGAALANQLLASSEHDRQAQRSFPRNVPVFALGAAFVAFPIAPTQETELMAARAGWSRLVVVLVASVFLVYLVLYELEFRGHAGRIEDRSRVYQVSGAFLVYSLAVAVSFLFLLAFGHFRGQPVSVWVQETIVLAFAASAGASAGEVVL